MIGGDQGGPAAVQRGALQFQEIVEVDVIEMQKGQQPRVGAFASEVNADVRALKMIGEQAGSQTADPFVEIAEQDARPGVIVPFEDLFIEQSAGLMAAFEIRSAEVHIVNVQQVPAVRLSVQPAVQVDIDAQTAALLSALDTDIVIVSAQQRKAAEHDISIGPAA